MDLLKRRCDQRERVFANSFPVFKKGEEVLTDFWGLPDGGKIRAMKSNALGKL